jgi:hypothetical protein
MRALYSSFIIAAFQVGVDTTSLRVAACLIEDEHSAIRVMRGQGRWGVVRESLQETDPQTIPS